MADSTYKKIAPPKDGEPITVDKGHLKVPDKPIIPFIEGDGTGRDIWKASVRVFDAAVEKAYKGKRRISWFEIYAGEKAKAKYDEWLPEDTTKAIRDYYVSIKGPLTTPIGGGIRSLNVALRQILDLYACVRPVFYFKGVPSPVKAPEKMDMIIYRENTEDVYAGYEWQQGTEEAKKLIQHLNTALHTKIREDSGVGIKPISRFGAQRLVRKAITHAIEVKRREGKPRNVTLVHKGNIMKYTEGAFRDWGYEVARTEFRKQMVTEREWGVLDMRGKNPSANAAAIAAKLNEEGWELYKEDEVKRALELWESHGGDKLKTKVMVKDRICDSMFQQILLRPDEYDVLATPNLNGDYLSDACAAQIGGLGLAPGANIGDQHALFEATHGTAPKYADKDVINPGAVILAGCEMLKYLGWPEAADLIHRGIQRSIDAKRVTYDLHRLMVNAGLSGVTKLKCSEFGTSIIEHMA